MTDVVLTKQRIEPGKTERLRAWSDEIRDREDEALETLENGGMHLEAAFVEHDDDGDYEAFDASEHEIDREHAEVLDEVLESPERVGDYELLYWLDNPERP